jgi:hypothetical protein
MRWDEANEQDAAEQVSGHDKPQTPYQKEQQ